VTRRRLVGTRQVANGVYVGHRVGRGRVVYVVRGGKVRYLAAISFAQARHKCSLLRRLHSAGLR